MFRLDQVVPWGRSFEEYTRMFDLNGQDFTGRILGCGDGPAAFNAGAVQRGARVVSCDPLYRYDRAEIAARIAATREIVLEQTRRHQEAFVWGRAIGSVEQLGAVRTAAMEIFLDDYDRGRLAGRYVDAALPVLPFADASFDLALCSHFLFLYSEQFDAAFHVAAVRELLRVAGEVRLFPLVTAMSIFFIFSIASMARSTRRAVWSTKKPPIFAGTICHDRPYLSLSQPHCWTRASPPFESASQSCVRHGGVVDEIDCA